MTAWDEVQDLFDDLEASIKDINLVIELKKYYLEESEYILFKKRIEIIKFVLEHLH